MITIELAGAPMGKQRVKRGGAGNAYLPEKTVQFEGRLALEAQRVMAGRPLLLGPLRVRVTAYMPIPASWSNVKQSRAVAADLHPTKKPDADNILKTLDGLNLVVWADDAQIVRAEVAKIYSQRPRVVVEIEEIV